MNRTIVNIVCSVFVLITNVAINLVLSPFIVETIGVEANGFVTLANNCVTYAQLITTALSSMAARFVTIERARGNHEKANLYYNSVFWGNLVVAVLLIVPAAACIIWLELVFDVPPDILMDVKILFAFVFVNFFVSTALPKWDCGPFAANRLDRSYIPQALAMLVRCIVLFAMFAFLAPHVWYVGLAASVMTAITLIANARNTHVLTPELRIGLKRGKRCFSISALKELLFSGVWNSIQSVGNMLLSGLDILVSNVLLGATAMGVVSLSKTLPTLMQQLSSSICNALAPELTIAYAKGDREGLLKSINRAMTLTSCIMTVPLAGIVVLADRFYRLWVPSQDANLLWALTALAVLGYAFTSGTQILYNVFTIVNKVRPNAIAVLASGAASIVVTLVLVRFTPLGVFAIAGVSTVMNLIRNMAFTLPATARYLGYRWYQFYPQVAKTTVSTLMLVILGFVVKSVVPEGSWGPFLLCATLFAIIGFAVNFAFFLSKEERKALLKKVVRFVGRKHH